MGYTAQRSVGDRDASEVQPTSRTDYHGFFRARLAVHQGRQQLYAQEPLWRRHRDERRAWQPGREALLQALRHRQQGQRRAHRGERRHPADQGKIKKSGKSKTVFKKDARRVMKGVTKEVTGYRSDLADIAVRRVSALAQSVRVAKASK